MTVKYTLASLITILLAACGGGGGSGAASSAEISNTLTAIDPMMDPRTGSYPSNIALSSSPAVANLSCINWAYYSTPNGRLSNNVWNAQSVGSASYSQCLTAQGPLNNKQFGWSWNWPMNSTTVVSFPEIIFGWKVWEGGVTNYAPLPKKISTITTFDWNYSVTVNTNGKHNIATDIWLTHTGVTSLAKNIADVTTEIMIWSDGHDWNPGNTMVGTITSNGTTFEVWHTPVMQDNSGSTNHTWTYVAYRATVPTSTININVKALLDDAVARGFISANDYVSDIELGNEVMTGSGQTWINSISLNVQ